jgi:hypothetical protein
MSPSAFIVSRFVNRNGITSWRVDGRLHGLRIRKNFKTRVEAGAEKNALDIRLCLGNKAQAVSQITMHAIVIKAAKVMWSFS